MPTPPATDLPVPSPVTSAPDWTEPDIYAFTLESACGERALIGTFRVSVQDHVTVEVIGLDESGRRFSGAPAAVPTLAGILREAEAAKARSADRVEVTLDPVDGHPTNVLIDPVANAIDDEACYRITAYSVDT